MTFILLSLLIFGGPDACLSLNEPDITNTGEHRHETVSIKTSNILPHRELIEGRVQVIRRRNQYDPETADRHFSARWINDEWITTIEKNNRFALSQSSDGDIVLTWEEDFREGVRIEYTPAIIILPAQLNHAADMGERVVDMTVSNRETGSPVDQGTCTYTLTRIQPATFKLTEQSNHSAVRLRQKRRIDLQTADADIVIDSTWLPEIGLVAEEVWEKRRTMGLLSVSINTQTKLIQISNQQNEP